MRRTLAIAALAAASAVAAPASAHHTAEHEDHGSAHHAAISQERALEIARAQGVATVREVELEDGNWKVEGRTENGRAIEVEIDAHSGAVVRREVSR